jgi:hypothetical protein
MVPNSQRWQTFGSAHAMRNELPKKEIAGIRRKERPLMRKELCHFPEIGGLCSYDIHPLY